MIQWMDGRPIRSNQWVCRMGIKEFLYQIRHERREIAELSDRIDSMYGSLLPAGIRYDKEKIQASPSMDPMSEAMVTILEYCDDLAKRRAKLYTDIRYAEALIACLEDSRERQVIDLYFMGAKEYRMEDVAVQISYSVQRCWQLYESALEHMERIREN